MVPRHANFKHETTEVNWIEWCFFYWKLSFRLKDTRITLPTGFQRLISGHVYEVNMAIATWSPFLSIRKSKYQRDIASKMR